MVERERNLVASALMEHCKKEHGDARGAARFADLVATLQTFLLLTIKFKDFDVYFKVPFEFCAT